MSEQKDDVGIGIIAIAVAASCAGFAILLPSQHHESITTGNEPAAMAPNGGDGGANTARPHTNATE